jgi:UDP-N-acetylglucosamine acyltransferase
MIHETAVIHPNAKVGNNCEIGPFCIITENVILGDDNYLQSNIRLDGHTTIGTGNKFFHSAAIGNIPQDLKYSGEPTELLIGNDNTFRECVTVNTSATMDEPTSIGNNNLLMAYVHVAHHCRLQNNLVIANAVNLAGHIHIDDNALIGGMTAISQFVNIGKHAFVSGNSGITKDIPPFTRGIGMPFEVKGINTIGLQRKGFTSEDLNSIKTIFKIFYKSGLNVSQALQQAEEIKDPGKYQLEFIEFVKKSRVGINK